MKSASTRRTMASHTGIIRGIADMSCLPLILISAGLPSASTVRWGKDIEGSLDFHPHLSGSAFFNCHVTVHPSPQAYPSPQLFFGSGHIPAHRVDPDDRIHARLGDQIQQGHAVRGDDVTKFRPG